MPVEDKVKLTWGFVWLNVSQFLGALNDNIFRFVVVFFLIDLKGAERTDMIMVLVSVVFVLPFLFFTAFAGVLADRISKRHIIMGAKCVEGLTMLAAALVFTRQSEWMVYAVLFSMTTQSAFFGPSKYGIIPELVGRNRLVKANSLIVLFTYLAIILGMGMAPALSELTAGNYVLIALICFCISAAGLVATLLMDRTPAAGSKQTASVLFVRDIWRTLHSIRGDAHLFMAVVASAFFVLLAAFMQMNLIPYGMEMLDLTEQRSTYLFFLAALGIGMGAVLVHRFSGRNIELGLVPLGALGVTLMMSALYFYPVDVWLVGAFVFVMGVSAGLYVVPLESFIQYYSPDDERGKILAAAGFLGWVGVLLASGVFMLLGVILDMAPPERFMIMASITLVLTIASFRSLPDFLVRLVVLVITRFTYRIRIIGREHVPSNGPALLVSNHVSWREALLLNATQQRRVRFMASRTVYDRFLLNPFLRMLGVIPFAEESENGFSNDTFQAVSKALDNGELVCLFAEGAVTRNGVLCGFKGMLDRIVDCRDAPVVPVYTGVRRGNTAGGRFFCKPFKYLLFMRRRIPATVLYGRALLQGAPANEVRSAVEELSVEYFNRRKSTRAPIGEELVRSLRSRWRSMAFNDTTGKELSAGKALIATIILAELIEKDGEGQDRIGIMLPSSAGGVLANLAVALLRKTSVNINYTASEEARKGMIEQGSIKTVITSRKFIEKVDWLSAPPGAVYVEDLLSRVAAAAKLRALFKAMFMPAGMLARSKGFDADEILTIIFSSGSTARPKGVMLSHHNILSNVEAFRMVYRPAPDENICAALPFFHSFGYTVTIWFPLLAGFVASYHTNPLEGARIAELVRDRQCTLLFATPTFLLNYIRKADKEDFRSLRVVITGAEKLKKGIADLFEERFEIRPLEGYGVTELAPVVSANLPPISIDGLRQSTIKDGSVGRPVPGVAVRVVDRDSFHSLPSNQSGILLVKGPNVMHGYLGMPELTGEVILDGWYVTGDIAIVDDEGFITITDRLSRFSKIGGEMVPHIAVEEAYLKGISAVEPVLTVASVPDKRKGERLVVLYTREAGDPEDLHGIILQSGLPKLWIPDSRDYYLIDEVPVLGSGKLDVKSVRKSAEKLAGGASAE